MKNNTPFIFISSLLLLIATGTSVWFVCKEIIQKVEVVRAHHVKEIQNKNLEFGNQLRVNADILNAQEQKIMEGFLKSNEVVNFITELETTAQALGLELSVETVTYGTSETIAGAYTVQPITFAIQINGPYSQIETLFASWKHSSKILVIKELDLNRSGEIGGGHRARVLLEGTLLSHE